MANYKKNSKLLKRVISFAIASICAGSIITPVVYASTTDTAIQYKSGNDNVMEQVDDNVNSFIDSISYDTKTQTLSFVVPKEIPEGYKWFVHITGHEQFSEGPGVFHLFEDESYNYTWEAGKKYEYTFKENPLIGCSFEVGILNRDISDDIKDDMIVTIKQNGTITKSKEKNYAAVNQLIGTINYDKSTETLSFTVPESIPEGYKWFIRVSGHEQLNNWPFVFNVFEDETYKDKYESGKTYTYTVKEGELINFSFDLGLKDENSNYIENYKTIVINKDGKIEYK